jgi:hypothetical protein
MIKIELPIYEGSKEYSISPEGLQRMLEAPKDKDFPNKNILWTDDFRVELPIRMGKSGLSSITPTTLID